MRFMAIIYNSNNNAVINISFFPPLIIKALIRTLPPNMIIALLSPFAMVRIILNLL